MKNDAQPIQVNALVSAKWGIYLEVENRKDDFWLFLGSAAGWGRFRQIGKRIKTPYRECFELVEVLPAHSQVPNPLLSIEGVLWRRQEAILAEMTIQTVRRDLGLTV